MAHAVHPTATPDADDTLSALFDFNVLSGVGDLVLRVQRLQLDALVTWQQSITSLQQELWDEWACRWGGGAPIDV
jgi:hypothetical protein